jgi:hypothetical protein
MAMDKAKVTLFLTTSEFILMKEQLEAQGQYHAACLQDEAIPAARRAMHRQKAGEIENLLSRLR